MAVEVENLQMFAIKLSKLLISASQSRSVDCKLFFFVFYFSSLKLQCTDKSLAKREVINLYIKNGKNEDFLNTLHTLILFSQFDTFPSVALNIL